MGNALDPLAANDVEVERDEADDRESHYANLEQHELSIAEPPIRCQPSTG
jgi:hypothetical protein